MPGPSANNKEIWKSLRTSHFSVAKARLAEFLREHREKRVAGANEATAKMTFAEALKIHQQNQADDVTIKTEHPALLEAGVRSIAQKLAGPCRSGSAANHENGLHRGRGGSAKAHHHHDTTILLPDLNMFSPSRARQV